MTTRIFRSTWAVYGGENLRHRLLPRLAQSGRRPLGLPARAPTGRLLVDCGPGRSRAAAPAGRLAARRCDRDHAFPPRPLGRPRAVGVGRHVPVRRGRRSTIAPSSGCTRVAGTCSRTFGERFGFRDMFDRVFTVREYAPEEPFMAAGFEVTPLRLPHYTLETYGFRLSADGRDDRLLGRQRPERAAGRARAGHRSLRLRGDARSRRRRRPAPRSPQCRRGARGRGGLRHEARAPHAPSGRARQPARRRTGLRRPRDRPRVALFHGLFARRPPFSDRKTREGPPGPSRENRFCALQGWALRPLPDVAQSCGPAGVPHAPARPTTRHCIPLRGERNPPIEGSLTPNGESRSIHQPRLEVDRCWRNRSASGAKDARFRDECLEEPLVVRPPSPGARARRARTVFEGSSIASSEPSSAKALSTRPSPTRPTP